MIAFSFVRLVKNKTKQKENLNVMVTVVGCSVAVIIVMGNTIPAPWLLMLGGFMFSV